MHLSCFSHAVTSVSYDPVPCNHTVGPVLKPWPDSPYEISTGRGGRKPKNGYKNSDNCGEGFHLSFKPRETEQGTHISLHP